MKKFFWVVLLLAGCSGSAKQRIFPVVPEELKDCKFYRLQDTDGSSITVARCGFPTTTVQSNGKSKNIAVLIDGVEYKKAEQ